MTQFPQEPQPYAGQPGSQPAVRSSEERTWAILAHIAGPVAMLISAGWLGFVGPLVIWYLARHKSSYVRGAAAGAFNFNLSLSIMSIIAWILLFTVILIPVSIVLWIVTFVLAVVCHLTGALRANRGATYVYPFQLRLLT